MNYALLVYLISLTEKVPHFLTGTGIAIYILCAVYLMFTLINADYGEVSHDFSAAFKNCKKYMILGTFITLSATIIPSKETSYMMVAAHLTQSVVENPKVSGISDKLLTIVNTELDNIHKKQVTTTPEQIKKVDTKIESGGIQADDVLSSAQKTLDTVQKGADVAKKVLDSTK